MAHKATIILTADRTLMSDYHRNEFLGFATAAPPYLVPEFIYRTLFFPPIKAKKGIPMEAPYALRKIEAQLLNDGFEVLTVDPDHLSGYIDEAKVLGITVMDPFGLGPSSATFSRILRTGEPYLSKYFRLLFDKPEVKRAKRRGLRIIVGGPGAWQFRYKPAAVRSYGIDCVIEGEAERVIGSVFRNALKNEELPQYYNVSAKEIPAVDEIPEIRNPSVNGLVEIGRGCCRGCQFCEVTTRPLRWYPYEKIEKELTVNAKAGVSGAVLHAEDVLLYASSNTSPNRERFLRLLQRSKKISGFVGWSHASMASIAANPKLIWEAAETLIDDQQSWWGTEIGIETGSPELLKKTMPAKAHPFKPEQWPMVVKEAAGLMTDNNIVPACTLIAGLPEETEDDLTKTIELIEDLDDFKSLIVPLFFTPLGRLKDKNWFMAEQMNSLHKELFIECLKHDVKWTKVLIRDYLEGKPYERVLTPLYRFMVWFAEQKLRTLKSAKPT